MPPGMMPHFIPGMAGPYGGPPQHQGPPMPFPQMPLQGPPHVLTQPPPQQRPDSELKKTSSSER